MNRFLIILIAFLSMGLQASDAALLKNDSQNFKIQQLANQYVSRYSNTDVHEKGEGISGLQLTVLQNDKIQTFVSGYTGHDSKKPVTPKNLFAWASITKEFTTAILLKLQEKGKLNLNQPLQYWFPEKFRSVHNKKTEWPKKWENVKIYQLLNMTSGIPNAINSKTLKTYWNKKRLFETKWNPGQLVDIAAQYERSKQCKKSCFVPGSNWSYSNTNYIIAELIAEKAAQKPFSVQMNDLLKNAGVTAYYIPNEKPASTLKNMMHGYFYDRLYPVAGFDVKEIPIGFDTSNTLAWSNSPASGALIGNTENLAKAVYALLNGKILSQKSTDLLVHDYFVNTKNGRPVANITQCTKESLGNHQSCYGLGVSVLYHKNIGPIYSYEGILFGYRPIYFYSPKENIIIAAAINSTAGTNDHLLLFTKNLFKIITEKTV